MIFETVTADIADGLRRSIRSASHGGWAPGLLWERGSSSVLSLYEFEDRDWVTERTPHPDEWEREEEPVVVG
jgi:hypothetical protein